MTLDEFLNEFAKVANKTAWYLDTPSRIRSEEGYCPICFLAKEKGLNDRGLKALGAAIVAENLGLGEHTTMEIIKAADYRNDMIRSRLIYITGAR